MTARLAILPALAWLGAAALGGCAPQVTYAGGDSIVFANVMGEPSNEVFRVAQAHCGRFGKRTQYDGVESGQRLKFQCVE